MPDSLEYKGKQYQLNKEGFLQDFSQWLPELSHQLAQRERIVLGQDHLEIISYLRDYYKTNHQHPVVRTVTAAMQKILGSEKGAIKYFHSLFPGGVHQAYKIAGLPMKQSCC
jgi:tRNA 2-thiouridine synthesizing protein E